MGVPHVNTSKWMETKAMEDVDVGLYMNTLFWNLNYFDAASTLAGEVPGP